MIFYPVNVYLISLHTCLIVRRGHMIYDKLVLVVSELNN